MGQSTIADGAFGLGIWRPVAHAGRCLCRTFRATGCRIRTRWPKSGRLPDLSAGYGAPAWRPLAARSAPRRGPIGPLRYTGGHERHRSRAPPRPTASGCPASSWRTRAVGWPGPSEGTSGGSRPGPRRRRSPRWRRRSAPVSPSRWASPTTSSRAVARCWRHRSGSSSCPPTTPGCATRDRPSCSTSAVGARGVDWHFNAWGGLQGGLYSPVGPRRARRRQGARGRAGRPLPRAAGARGRLDPLSTARGPSSRPKSAC